MLPVTSAAPPEEQGFLVVLCNLKYQNFVMHVKDLKAACIMTSSVRIGEQKQPGGGGPVAVNVMGEADQLSR